MKLKQLPDDFFVEEATAVSPADRGPFALYRLEKRGWSTPDALAALRRRWRIEARRVSYGGLKDRHAWTIQYLTIFHGPARGLHHHDVTVTHLGWTDAPYTSHDIRCNRFRLTLRDLSPEAAARGDRPGPHRRGGRAELLRRPALRLGGRRGTGVHRPAAGARPVRGRAAAGADRPL